MKMNGVTVAYYEQPPPIELEVPCKRWFILSPKEYEEIYGKKMFKLMANSAAWHELEVEKVAGGPPFLLPPCLLASGSGLSRQGPCRPRKVFLLLSLSRQPSKSSSSSPPPYPSGPS